MFELFQWVDQVGVGIEFQGLFVFVDFQVVVYVGGEVDDYIGVVFVDMFDYFMVQCYVVVGFVGGGVVDMVVGDGGVGFGCFDGGFGNLFWSDWDCWMLVDGIVGVGYCVGDDDFMVYGGSFLYLGCMKFCLVVLGGMDRCGLFQ